MNLRIKELRDSGIPNFRHFSSLLTLDHFRHVYIPCISVAKKNYRIECRTLETNIEIMIITNVYIASV